ncbi:kinase-like protein, partial [Rickenella mellea]
VSEQDIGKNVEKTGKYYIKIGEFGDIWDGWYTLNGKKIRVAIKQLRGAPAHNKKLISQLRRQLFTAGRNWRLLVHPNVCNFYGLCFDYGYLPALVVQFHENGNVMEYLQNAQEKTVPQPNRLMLILDVSNGLEYLHSQSIVHGDVRGFNILVTDSGHACLTDFGLILIIDNAEFTRHKLAGPARWSAPEILDPPEDMLGRVPYSKMTDMFAFAMTCVELATLAVPFSERKNDSAVIMHVLNDGRPELPPLLAEHEQIAGVIRHCWSRDPEQRPSASHVHAVFQKLFEESK